MLVVHSETGKVFLKEFYFAGKKYLSTLNKKKNYLFCKVKCLCMHTERDVYSVVKGTCAFLTDMFCHFTVSCKYHSESLR